MLGKIIIYMKKFIHVGNPSTEIYITCNVGLDYMEAYIQLEFLDKQLQ